jgi:hypothetical protein
LWPHLDESVTEETAYHCPMESSPHSYYGEGFAHACPNELLGVRVQDNVVEQLRVAIENRRHHAMARRGDPVAKILRILRIWFPAR